MRSRTVVLWIAACAMLLAADWSIREWVDRAELPELHPDVSTVVEARDGQLLRAFTVADGRWRLPVDVQDVSPGYLAQLLAFEDKRFYSHGGVDFRAAMRAVVQAIWHGKVVSGGSTLTMQVARLLEESGTGSWRGKVRQVRVAWALEEVLTKDEILNLYLRIAPFGGNMEGVRAAALGYLQKEPYRLTDAEAALLVAIPQSPETRRPDRHAQRARAARDRVLQRSAKAGAISAEAAQAARREVVPTQRHKFEFLAPHLAQRIVGENPLPARHRLTIERDFQWQAERLLAAHVVGKRTSLSGAVMIVEHQNGAVLASVGSPDYLDAARHGFVDMTRAVRSPGSTLKPLIYGLAFDEGIAHPETIVDDQPIWFGRYAPQNFDNQFRGQVSVREALQASLNIPAVTLLDAVGPTVLMARMKRAGAVPVLPKGAAPKLAIGLGGVGVTLQDLMAIFSTIARGGRAVPLVYSSENVAEFKRALPVLNPVSSWYVRDILAGVQPPPGAMRKGVAYKTGTSYGHRDVWAIGFDGRHTVGVWIGHADGTSMPGALGNSIAAPLLFDVFAAIKPALDPLPPPPDAALTVDNSALPARLRHFRKRGSIKAASHAPQIVFPPNGARIFLTDEPFLVAKVDRGLPPFTWLANGVPVVIGSFERQVELPQTGPGHLAISVIDARGTSQAVRVILE